MTLVSHRFTPHVEPRSTAQGHPSCRDVSVLFCQGNLGEGVLKISSLRLHELQTLWNRSLWVVTLPFLEASLCKLTQPQLSSPLALIGQHCLDIKDILLYLFSLIMGIRSPHVCIPKRGNLSYSSGMFSTKLSAWRKKNLPYIKFPLIKKIIYAKDQGMF